MLEPFAVSASPWSPPRTDGPRETDDAASDETQGAAEAEPGAAAGETPGPAAGETPGGAVGETRSAAAADASGEAAAAPRDADAPLPLEALTFDELEAQLGAQARPTDEGAALDVMRAEGVEDPFPDRIAPARPHRAGILLGVGGGVAVAATITARLTLLPQCGNERDAMTCSIPDRADIGVRVGRLVGTVAFSIGGAALGALGGRELDALLRERAGIERGRRIAIGLGVTSTLLGVAGLLAGAVVLGTSADHAVAVGRTFQGVTALTDADTARLDGMLADVRTARVGLMVLAASPTLFATGVALLAHRPREPRVRVSPMASRRSLGLSATVRF